MIWRENGLTGSQVGISWDNGLKLQFLPHESEDSQSVFLLTNAASPRYFRAS